MSSKITSDRAIENISTFFTEPRTTENDKKIVSALQAITIINKPIGNDAEDPNTKNRNLHPSYGNPTDKNVLNFTPPHQPSQKEPSIHKLQHFLKFFLVRRSPSNKRKRLLRRSSLLLSL